MGVSKCTGDNCPIAGKCHRFTKESNERWQSWSKFTYDNGCEFFIQNESKTTIKKVNETHKRNTRKGV